MATTTSFGDSPGAITAIDGSVTRNANLTVETSVQSLQWLALPQDYFVLSWS